MFNLNKLSPSITDMIRFDHSHVLVTFHQYSSSARPSVKKALAETICDALEIHATLEEEIFYPVIRRLDPGNATILKAEPEHDEMRRFIRELRATSADDIRHGAVLHDLMRDVMHHVADEETTLLPMAERLLGTDQLNEMGAAMTHRRLELLKPKAGKIAKNTAVGFSGSTTAIVVGLAGALVAARLVAKRVPDAGVSHP